MNLLVLTGSPHRSGTSDLLAESFLRGAREKGHEVRRFDAACEEIHPCVGCDHCKRNGGACVYPDGMEKLRTMIASAELLVLVTPLYSYGMTAQLKAVLDRFYAFGGEVRESVRQTMLLATSGDDKDWTMGALIAHYHTFIRYFGWEDRGVLLAQGFNSRAEIEQSEYPQRAYELGLSL